jgi:prepilin peptidase CpaA
MKEYGLVRKEGMLFFMFDNIDIIFLSIFLVVAFYFDAKEMRLPNWLMLVGVAVGLILHTVLSGFNGLKFSLFGILVGFGMLLLLHIFKAVGAGDVKLFGAIGSFTGTELVLHGIMYSIIYAGIIGLVMLVVRRELFQRMFSLVIRLFEFRSTKNLDTMEEYKKKEALRFPFMYAVLPGMITAFYYLIVL